MGGRQGGQLVIVERKWRWVVAMAKQIMAWKMDLGMEKMSRRAVMDHGSTRGRRRIGVIMAMADQAESMGSTTGDGGGSSLAWRWHSYSMATRWRGTR